MKIILKENNRPNQTGVYLLKQRHDSKPVLAEIRMAGRNGELFVVAGVHVLPIDKYASDTLWSEKLVIENE